MNTADFNPNELKNLNNEYFPAYSWVWNDCITEEGIISGLDDMLKADIKNIYVIPESKDFRPSYMPTYMEPDYLTDEYFRLFAFASKEAEKRGMQVWIYDEDGWPSGTAGGKTAENDPSIRIHNLVYEKDSDGNITFDVKDTSGEKYYPNLMLGEATDAFIKVTHEEYKKYLDDLFGKTVKAVFTDEPHISLISYDEKLYDGFYKKYGYRIDDYKEALFSELARNDEESKKARADFYEYCSDMFAENYFAKTRAWCNENGLLFTGHVNGDDSVNFSRCNGNILRVLREMDIPGVDVIYRQVFPKEYSVETYSLAGESYPVDTCTNMFFPRFASSVAHTMKRNRVLAECFAVYGGGMSFDEMRYVINFLAVRGVNLFNLMSISYGSRGHVAGGMRPCFSSDMPAYDGLRTFNGYMAYVSYLLSRGTPNINQAVYMPVRSWWSSEDEFQKGGKEFEVAGRSIEKYGADFDIIDDDDINADRISSYKKIFVPGWAFAKDGVKENLEKFIISGGKVYTTVETDISGAELISACDAGKYADTLVKISPAGDIRTTVRNLEGGAKIVFLYNEGFGKTAADIDLGEDVVLELDVVSGQMKKASRNVHLNLVSGQEKVYILGREYETADEVKLENELILTDFEVKRVSQFKVDNALRRKEFLDEDFVPAGSGETVFNGEFSGTAVYKTKFNLNAKKAKLVFENVKISASVTLNGRLVTENPLVFTPFEVDISDYLENGENILEITVSNTVSDEIVNTEFPAEYNQGPYHHMVLSFEEKAKGGGIEGVAKIIF